MADQITNPRRLEQIFWHKGITDGDVRQGFASRLDNVEIDRPGQIRSRNGIVEEDFDDASVGQRVAFRINGDPSGVYPNGWVIIINSSNIIIQPYGGNSSSANAAVLGYPDNISSIDISSVDAIIVGANIYISSNDLSGSPNFIIVCNWSGTKDRFKAPLYIDSGNSLYGQNSTQTGWSIFTLLVSPELKVFGYLSTDEYTAVRNRTMSEAVDFVSRNSRFGVSLYVEPQRATDSECAPKFSKDGVTTVKYCTVFEMLDGSITIPSNEVTIAISNLNDDYDIGVSVIVDREIDKTINAIRVYRKIEEGIDAVTGDPIVVSGAFDLLFTAFMNDTSADDSDGSEESGSNGQAISQYTTKDIVGGEERDSGCRMFSSLNDTRTTHPASGWTWEHILDRTHNITGFQYLSYENKIFTGGVPSRVKATEGWMRCYAGSDAMIFMPSHYFQSGDTGIMNMYIDDQNYILSIGGEPAGLGLSITNPIRLFDKKIVSASENKRTFEVLFTPVTRVFGNTYSYERMQCIIKGGRPTGLAKIHCYITSGGVSSDFGIVSPGAAVDSPSDDGLLSSDILARDIDAFRGYFTGDHGGIHSYNNPWPSVAFVLNRSVSQFEPGIRRVFAMYRDSASPSVLPTLENEFKFGESHGTMEVRPRIIGSSSGRLFALNYENGNKNNVSGVAYSEFMKPSVFLEANIIEYGIRDGGTGVAILTQDSYIIVLHDSSTYVFDISGGEDFTWREVGSYYDIGCVNKNLAVSTPFGIFWCDRSHLYWFKNNQPVPISDEVKDRYKVFLDTATRLVYKEDLRQLWLCAGNEALVFDITSGAFHEHQITEIEESSISHMFSVGKDQYMFVNTNNYSEFRVFKFTEDYTVGFKWGFLIEDFDLGVPEIVKKIKRLYAHFVPSEIVPDSNKQIEITASGDSSGQVYIKDDLVDGGQLRLSVSIRGYGVSLSGYVLNEETESGSKFWKGKIESLGISYKSKKLK